MTIDDLYVQRLMIPHNINEHMPVLRRLASGLETVCEIGTDIGFSTTAFIKARPKRLLCYDINRTSWVSTLLSLAEQASVKMEFHLGYSRDAEIPECDLLFIDSDHTYECLKEELTLHGNKASKFLVLHDTETFPEMMPAVSEFLNDNPHWKLRCHYKHQNGLTVFERSE